MNESGMNEMSQSMNASINHPERQHLRRRDDGERVHNSIRVFFSDFGDEESSHSTSGAAAQ